MSEDVCLVNLGPRQTRLRLVGGLVGLAAGLTLGAYALVADGPTWLRLAAVGAVGFAALSLLQARAKT